MCHLQEKTKIAIFWQVFGEKVLANPLCICKNDLTPAKLQKNLCEAC